MATAKEVMTAEKLFGSIRGLTQQATNLAINITQLTTYFEGLTAGQKSALIDILVSRGHTQAEVTAFYTQLKNVRDQINVLVVNKELDPAF